MPLLSCCRRTGFERGREFQARTLGPHGSLGRILPLIHAHRWKVEIVPRPRIAMSSHAPHGVQAERIDMELLGVDNLAPEMACDHLAENDFTGTADPEGHVAT